MIIRPFSAVASLACLTIAGSLIGSQPANALPKSNLTVTIAGLKSQAGQVCLSLFSNGQGFPEQGNKAVQARCVKVTEIPLAVTFSDIPAGSYAVTVLHDANNNGQVDRNGLGIPTEGFGFSRNPRILTGPPSFGDASVVVAGPTQITIQLQHF